MRRRLSFSSAPCKLALLTGLVVGMGNPVLAAEVGDNAQPIRFGDANLYLGAKLRYLTDDNKTRSGTDPLDLQGTVISPTAILQADKGSLNFIASYEGGYGSFDDSNFDFNDHVAAISVGSVLSRRLRVSADASYVQRHDEFDEATDAGTVVRDDLVISRNTQLNASMTYGAENARGNLTGGVTLLRHELDELDAGNASVAPDYDLVEPALQLSLRVSEDTRFTIGVLHGLYDYENDNSDRTITRGLVGLEFSPTGKLRGFFRVGTAYSSYDTGVNPSRTNAIFNTVITYRPVTYSRFTFRAARRLDNSDDSVTDFSGFGTTADTYKLEWYREWSARIATDSYISLVSTDRECPSDSSDATSAGAKVIYSFLRSWTVSLGIQHDTRDSSLCPSDTRDQNEVDYDRQKFDLILGYTL